MLSKTSFCNGTVVKKDLTRFAPLWMGYAICLVVGLVLEFTDTNALNRNFWFGYRVMQTVSIVAVVNIVYALIVAQVLFGDLYTGRICNMLHAFPLRREGWFLSHCLSGLLFSLIPTAIMTVCCLGMLAGTVFHNGWMLAIWLFLGANLSYLCSFGMAVFAAQCVGSRFTMVAGYGLLHSWAILIYYMVYSVYTPMLHGVIAPSKWAEDLTPLMHFTEHAFLETKDSISELTKTYGENLKGAMATFTVTDEWWRLWVLAAVGVVFAGLGLVLYRKRDLERSGDAVAFPWLETVFNVLCAVFVAVAAHMVLVAVLGMKEVNYILWLGLVVGWFIGRMLIERSTRVFRVKNLCGILALWAVFALSLGLTKWDVLGIEERIPKAEDIASVSFGYEFGEGDSQQDIGDALRIHTLALEERLAADMEYDSGTFIQDESGQWIRSYDYLKTVPTDEEGYYLGTPPAYRTMGSFTLTYTLNNGRSMQRRYSYWMDSELGQILKNRSSTWENVSGRNNVLENGREVPVLDVILADFDCLIVENPGAMRNIEIEDKAVARSLIQAVKADCEAGNMATSTGFHTGYFAYEDVYSGEPETTRTIFVYMVNADRKNNYTWSVSIRADSEHCIQWLKDNNLLEVEVVNEQYPLWQTRADGSITKALG